MHSRILRQRAWPVASRGPADGADRSFTKADFDRHIEQLQKKIPSKDFTVIVTPPFVVIGDESPEMVRRRSEDTVKWAVEKLKKAYFKQDPRQILDIWLFKDKESYETNCKRLFGKTPDTPYGYFSQQDGALVMNISTGGGTLVHEIVHPFVAANFPNCPAWFNEGLGSLYEQSGELDGEIHGYTNWRLPRLQEAIRNGNLPSFDDALPHHRHRVLRKGPRHELRPSPIPVLLPAAEGPLEDLLSPLPGEPQGRSVGLQDPEGRLGTRRHG